MEAFEERAFESVPVGAVATFHRLRIDADEIIDVSPIGIDDDRDTLTLSTTNIAPNLRCHCLREFLGSDLEVSDKVCLPFPGVTGKWEKRFLEQRQPRELTDDAILLGPDCEVCFELHSRSGDIADAPAHRPAIAVRGDEVIERGTVVAGETCSSREVSIDLAEKERIEHMPARVRQRHGLQSTALWPECGTHIRMGKRMSLGRV